MALLPGLNFSYMLAAAEIMAVLRRCMRRRYKLTHRFFDHFEERLPIHIRSVPLGPSMTIWCYRILATELYNDGQVVETERFTHGPFFFIGQA